MRGFLYIAQPPLYRAKRGNSEVYLKNDHALEDHLIPGGLDGVVLVVGSDGSQLAGPDLRAAVEHARHAKALITPLARRVGSRDAVEQGAILGALDPNVLADAASAQAVAEVLAKRLDALLPETERGWHAAPRRPSALIVERKLRGETDRAVIDQVVINSVEARRLGRDGGRIAAFLRPLRQAAGEGHGERDHRSDANTDRPVARARQEGVAMQRYKGLGEMNPEQLWENDARPQGAPSAAGQGEPQRRGPTASSPP